MTPTPERRLEDLDRRIPAARKPPQMSMPNVIEFATSRDYLGQRLYPRQATWLKLVFLQDELCTPYDWEVLGEWRRGFTLEPGARPGGRWVGGYGVPGDVLERMARCKAQGRRWFHEVLAVQGRRGSKGYLGAIALAYIVWCHLATGDPHAHYRLGSQTPLSGLVFAVNKDQAREVFFRTTANMIAGARCFDPFVAEYTAERLALWSPNQLVAGAPRLGMTPALEIVAKEATETAGRGLSSFAQVFDEAAHAVGAGSNRSAEEIYRAATPGLSQLGGDGFIYLPSSPRHQTGQFFESYQLGLAVTPEGAPEHPSILVGQFPSWELYRDWQEAPQIPMYPAGPCFPAFTRALVDEHDDELARTRATDPTKFRVEYGAQWAEVDEPFLLRDKVLAIFDPWGADPLEMREGGARLDREHVCHVDLSRVGDNSAVVIAHAEWLDGDEQPHFVVDNITIWRPGDFPDGEIFYPRVEATIKEYLRSFRLTHITFDQMNSGQMIQNLRDYAHTQLGRHPSIETRQPTQQWNWDIAQGLKVAVYQGRVHSPPHDLLRDELLFLEDKGNRVDHPSTGPVTTNDVATALMETIATLLRLTQDPGKRLASLRPSGHPGIGPRTNDEMAAAFSAAGRRPGPVYQRLVKGRAAPPSRTRPHRPGRIRRG